MASMNFSLFAEKYDHDDRQPLITWGNWGVTGMVTLDPLFMVQFIVLISILNAINALCGVLAYYFIVKEKEGYKASITGLFVGYGLLLPVLSYTPYWLIRTFDIRNCLFLINLVGVPVIMVLRLVEALHGSRLPEFAKNSLIGFLLYYSVPLVLAHDKKQPIRATWKDIQHKLLKIASVFLQTSLLLSFLAENDYEIFPTSPRNNIFYWGNLANNFAAAALISLVLDVSCAFGEVALCLVTGGLHFTDSHLSPMSASTSISQFWGKNWNILVNDSLKRGAFGPLRRVAPRSIAAILTFLTSGLVHEYMLFVLDSARTNGDVSTPANNLERQPYRHNLGFQSVFFLWNGVLLVLEQIFAKNKVMIWMQNNLPKLVRTALMLLLVLPITNYFTDEYNEAGIFRDVAMAFPRVEYLRTEPADVPRSRTKTIPFDGTLLNYTVKQLSSNGARGLKWIGTESGLCTLEQPSTACNAVQYLLGESKLN